MSLLQGMSLARTVHWHAHQTLCLAEAVADKSRMTTIIHIKAFLHIMYQDVGALLMVLPQFPSIYTCRASTMLFPVPSLMLLCRLFDMSRLPSGYIFVQCLLTYLNHVSCLLPTIFNMLLDYPAILRLLIALQNWSHV